MRARSFIFGLIAAASLVLSAAALWTWPPGYDASATSRWRYYPAGGGEREVAVYAGCGRLCVTVATFPEVIHDRGPGRGALVFNRWHEPVDAAKLPRSPLAMTFHFGARRQDYRAMGLAGERWQAWAPAWAVALVAGLLPSAWARHLLRRAWRRRRGRCVPCGYDLRASNDRCPECGMPIPVKA